MFDASDFPPCRCSGAVEAIYHGPGRLSLDTPRSSQACIRGGGGEGVSGRAGWLAGWPALQSCGR